MTKYYSAIIEFETIGANFIYSPINNPMDLLLEKISEIKSKAKISVRNIKSTGSGNNSSNSAKFASAELFFEESECHIFDSMNISYEIEDRISLSDMIIGNPELFETIENPSKEIRLLAIKHKPDNIKLINDPTYDEWELAVYKNPCLISLCKNPPLELQLVAVNSDGKVALNNIEIHSPELQQYVMKKYTRGWYVNLKNHTVDTIKKMLNKDGNNIKYIEDQREEYQLLAIKNKASSIRYIKEPTKKAIHLAICIDYNTLEYIKNPTDDIIMKSIKQHGSIVHCIKNPSRKIQEYMIRESNYSLSLQKIDDDLQIELLNNYPNAFRRLNNQSDEIIKLALSLDGDNIKYVKNQKLEYQIIALKQNPNCITKIRNPCKTAIAQVVDDVENKYIAKIMFDNVNNKAIKTYLAMRFNGFV